MPCRCYGLAGWPGALRPDRCWHADEQRRALGNPRVVALAECKRGTASCVREAKRRGTHIHKSGCPWRPARLSAQRQDPFIRVCHLLVRARARARVNAHVRACAWACVCVCMNVLVCAVACAVGCAVAWICLRVSARARARTHAQARTRTRTRTRTCMHEHAPCVILT